MWKKVLFLWEKRLLPQKDTHITFYQATIQGQCLIDLLNLIQFYFALGLSHYETLSNINGVIISLSTLRRQKYSVGAPESTRLSPSDAKPEVLHRLLTE